MQDASHDSNDITARLTRLEHESARQARSASRWRRACAGFGLAAGAVVFMGQGGAATKIDAESFRLVSGGKLRGLLTTTDKGIAQLSLMDGNQKPRIYLSCGEDARPQVVILDASGKQRVVLSVTKGEDGTLLFSEPGGKTRVSLTGEPAALICNDDQGAARAMLAVSSKGAGVFQIKDAEGKVVK